LRALVTGGRSVSVSACGRRSVDLVAAEVEVLVHMWCGSSRVVGSPTRLSSRYVLTGVEVVDCLSGLGKGLESTARSAGDELDRSSTLASMIQTNGPTGPRAWMALLTSFVYCTSPFNIEDRGGCPRLGLELA